MATGEAKFFRDGNGHATRAYDDLLKGKASQRGQLNFSAMQQGHDPQFLGVNGKNYYAKPWGNDSSNVQAVLNGPAYWKRVYYRPNIAAAFQQSDFEESQRKEAYDAAEADRKLGIPEGMRKSASEPALKKLPPEPVADGYQAIKDSMRPFVERQGKPRIKAPSVGERLNFFNTLDNKYHMKAGGKHLSWNVDKQGHRSTKTEARWILSNYFRTDTQAVLSGLGSEPVLKKEPTPRPF